MLKCTLCGHEGKDDDFRLKNGCRQNLCKNCENAKSREYYMTKKINMQYPAWNDHRAEISTEVGCYIECRCGYSGPAEEKKTQMFRSGSIERCPKCRRVVQDVPKPAMKQETLPVIADML